MSDHPVAGRGVGGFQVEVEAHRRAARADAVLDMAGAWSLRRIDGVDHIAAVDAARALFGGKDRTAMLAGLGGVLDMHRPVADGPPPYGTPHQVVSGHQPLETSPIRTHP